jgi:hypothetical protein
MELTRTVIIFMDKVAVRAALTALASIISSAAAGSMTQSDNVNVGQRKQCPLLINY